MADEASGPASGRRALVLGAGITGLAAARSLRRAGWTVAVLEASDRVGGTLATHTLGGCRFELGPNTVQESPELIALCEDAGCADGLRRTSTAAARRYLVRDGRLVALPGSPPALLTSPLFTVAGKLRILTEPWRRRGSGPEEALADFVRRRLGRQAVAIVDAMAHGVYAGDPSELAVGHAFPRLFGLERAYGSLFRGMQQHRRAAARAGDRPGPSALVGFDGGFANLAARLAKGLDVRLGSPIAAVSRRQQQHSQESSGRASFCVTLRGVGSREPLHAERLISALPLHETISVLADLGPSTCGLEASPELLPHAPVAVVQVVVPRDAVGHPLDGFGFLVPHAENLPILGCLFVSSLFADAAPENRAALTVLLGGRRAPELVDEDDATLVAKVVTSLEQLIHLRATPTETHVSRWQPGIPQPTAAWPAVQAAANQLEAAHPGLTILGNWRTGVGVPDCIRAGWTVGQQIRR